MKAKDEMMTTLRHLSLDRKAVIMMKEDISRIEEDIKKSPPPCSGRLWRQNVRG